MSGTKLAVFPAAGALGTSIYTHLLDLKLVEPTDVLLVSRHPEKIAAKYKDSGIEARRADYDEPQSFDHVFDGVSCLHLISYPTFAHKRRTEVHKLAIDAARHAGVSHIFYSSLAFGGDCKLDSKAHVMQAHLDTEKYLASIAAEDSSFTYTAVRQGIYSESFPIYTAFFTLKSENSQIQIPHDGSGPGIAWAKRDELGEATAQLTAQYVKSPKSFTYNNKTLLLSGPRVWGYDETLKVLGKAAGKDLHIQQVSVDEYVDQPSMQTFNEPYGPGETGRMWATAFEAIKDGECAVPSTMLGELLGREPEKYEDTIATIGKSIS